MDKAALAPYVGKTVVLGIRPEDIDAVPNGEAHDLEGRIEIAELMGDTEKMVLNVYNHIIDEKEDVATAPTHLGFSTSVVVLTTARKKCDDRVGSLWNQRRLRR